MIVSDSGYRSLRNGPGGPSIRRASQSAARRGAVRYSSRMSVISPRPFSVVMMTTLSPTSIVELPSGMMN